MKGQPLNRPGGSCFQARDPHRTDIPNLHRGVALGRGQAPAIGIKSKAANVSLTRLKVVDFLARGNIPDMAW